METTPRYEVRQGAVKWMIVPVMQQMYAQDGTPVTLSKRYLDWPVIGYVTCLFAWQRGEITTGGSQ